MKATLYTEEMKEQYLKASYWTPVTHSDLWNKNARLYPAKEAVVDSKTRLTWAEANKWVDRLALSFLEMGLKKDDAVVIQLPNCVELVCLRAACERAGLIQMPVVRVFRQAEMGHILKYAEAKALVIPWKYRDFDYFKMVQELKPSLPSLKHILILGDEAPEGTALLKELVTKPLENKYPPHYLESKKMPWWEFSLVATTTGSTGMPKCVEQPICALLAGTGEKDIEMTGNDIVAAMTNAAMGPNIPTYSFSAKVAAKVAMLEHWTIEDGLELIEKEKTTIIGVVPTQLVEINEYPYLKKYDLSSLRLINCTGAQLPYHMALEVEAKLKCPIINVYGAVDFGGMSQPIITDSKETRLLTAGRPLWGNEGKIIDDSGKELPRGQIGKIAFRGAKGASGYFKDPEATARTRTSDGWYITGDLGKMDERGYLTIAGRSDDMIIRGGQNIMPAELENILLTHPKIKDAAIMGIPDAKMGERACACVVPKPGQKISFEEMVAFLKEKRIAPYKFPEKFLLFEFLPYASGLKKDKKQLKVLVQQRLR